MLYQATNFVGVKPFELTQALFCSFSLPISSSGDFVDMIFKKLGSSLWTRTTSSEMKSTGIFFPELLHYWQTDYKKVITIQSIYMVHTYILINYLFASLLEKLKEPSFFMMSPSILLKLNWEMFSEVLVEDRCDYKAC